MDVGWCNTPYSLKVFLLYRLPKIDGNIRTHPKFIVFWTQLMFLFKFCHSCKSDNSLIEANQVGTDVVVRTTCSNPTCKQKVSTWESQLKMPNMAISAGNFLLSMATLISGGSMANVQQIFSHMGLSCICLHSYFPYQKVSNASQLYLFFMLKTWTLV